MNLERKRMAVAVAASILGCLQTIEAQRILRGHDHDDDHHSNDHNDDRSNVTCRDWFWQDAKDIVNEKEHFFTNFCSQDKTILNVAILAVLALLIVGFAAFIVTKILGITCSIICCPCRMCRKSCAKKNRRHSVPLLNEARHTHTHTHTHDVQKNPGVVVEKKGTAPAVLAVDLA